jgi:hypothetical protein
MGVWNGWGQNYIFLDCGDSASYNFCLGLSRKIYWFVFIGLLLSTLLRSLFMRFYLFNAEELLFSISLSLLFCLENLKQRITSSKSGKAGLLSVCKYCAVEVLWVSVPLRFGFSGAGGAS